jgi:hypothetical protein
MNLPSLNTNNNRIQKFSPTGIFLAKWGSVGIGDGQFDQPSAVAVDLSGNVYVADSGNNRIQKFAIQTVTLTATLTPTPTSTTIATTVPTTVHTTAITTVPTTISTTQRTTVITTIPTTGQTTVVTTVPTTEQTTRLTTAPTTLRTTIKTPTPTPTTDNDAKIAALEKQLAEQKQKIEEQGNILDRITNFLRNVFGWK